MILNMVADNHRVNKRVLFTLIELIIVVFVIAALSTIMIPSFEKSKDNSKQVVATSELRTIQKTFLKFYYDVRPSDADLEKIFNEGGFWVLYSISGGTAPNDVTFTTYDPEYRRGWRGPYIENEGTAAVPTVKDPWGNNYQFLAPVAFDKSDVILISTGSDGTAETSAGDTEASGDDIMLKLFL